MSKSFTKFFGFISAEEQTIQFPAGIRLYFEGENPFLSKKFIRKDLIQQFGLTVSLTYQSAN